MSIVRSLAVFAARDDSAFRTKSVRRSLDHLNQSRSPSYDRLRFLSRFGHHLVGLRDPNDFFDGCFAFSDASPTVLPQSLHAFGDGALLELTAIAFSHDHLSQ